MSTGEDRSCEAAAPARSLRAPTFFGQRSHSAGSCEVAALGVEEVDEERGAPDQKRRSECD
jgi:hypothetical protein